MALGSLFSTSALALFVAATRRYAGPRVVRTVDGIAGVGLIGFGGLLPTARCRTERQAPGFGAQRFSSLPWSSRQDAMKPDEISSDSPAWPPSARTRSMPSLMSSTLNQILGALASLPLNRAPGRLRVRDLEAAGHVAPGELPAEQLAVEALGALGVGRVHHEVDEFTCHSRGG